MKRKEGQKSSFSENISLIKRALSIISELTPHRLAINVIKAVIDALTPYIAIYMSALIIDELTEGRNLSVLIQYVLITTGGTLFFHIISAILQQKIVISNSVFHQELKRYLNNIKLNLDANSTQMGRPFRRSGTAIPF